MKKLIIMLIAVSLVAITGVSYACYTCNYYKICPSQCQDKLKVFLEKGDYISYLKEGFTKTKESDSGFTCVRDVYETDEFGGHIIMRIIFFHRNKGVYNENYLLSDSSASVANPETEEYDGKYRKYSLRAVYRDNQINIVEINSLDKPYLSQKEIIKLINSVS